MKKKKKTWRILMGVEVFDIFNDGKLKVEDWFGVDMVGERFMRWGVRGEGVEWDVCIELMLGEEGVGDGECLKFGVG